MPKHEDSEIEQANESDANVLPPRLKPAPPGIPERLGWQLRYGIAWVTMLGRGVRRTNLVQKDNLALFPEFDLVVNRIKKSGNSSLVAVLHDLAGGAVFGNVDDLKNSRRLRCARIRTIVGMRRYRSLVIVRSPYDRALSGFLDKIAPGRNPMFASFPGYGEETSAGLERFLHHLRQTDYGGDAHFFPQTRLLFQPLSQYTFVAHLETLSEDMAEFLPMIGIAATHSQAFAKPHSLERAEAGKITGSAGKRHLISPGAVTLVNELYEEDFRQLGYARQAPDSV